MTLELAIGTDPISGRLRSGDGEQSFIGWLALVRALEEATAAATEKQRDL